MAFYRKVLKRLCDRWYPQSVLVGSPITTDQLAKRLAQESTVSAADVKAVLEALSGVMGEYMAMGRSVKLDGIGSFFFQATARKNGKLTPEEVDASLINGIKVRFLPATTYKRAGSASMKGRKATRALTDVDIEWIDIDSLSSAARDLYSSSDEALNGKEE